MIALPQKEAECKKASRDYGGMSAGSLFRGLPGRKAIAKGRENQHKQEFQVIFPQQFIDGGNRLIYGSLIAPRFQRGMEHCTQGIRCEKAFGEYFQAGCFCKAVRVFCHGLISFPESYFLILYQPCQKDKLRLSIKLDKRGMCSLEWHKKCIYSPFYGKNVKKWKSEIGKRKNTRSGSCGLR